MSNESELGALRKLLQSDRVTPATRAALQARLDAAQSKTTAPRFFDADPFALLEAVCARLFPQPDRAEPIRIAIEIDARLANKQGDGWRYDTMPPDGEAYRLGLHGIDETARAQFAAPFVALDEKRQDQILRAVQHDGVRGGMWERVSGARFFEDLLAECTGVYYSHPLAYMEIGYFGFADAHGWNIGGEIPHMPQENSTLFRYDPSKALQVKRNGEKTQDGVTVADLAFTMPSNETLKAYWVMPNGEGPFPAILFVHPAPGSRDTFLGEAVTLARRGAASLVLDAPWAQTQEWIAKVSRMQGNRELFIQVVIHLRRIVDWMIEQPNISATQIVYVGHSYGAFFGGILTGIEKRIQAFALLTGTGSFTDIALANVPDLSGAPLRDYSESVDPIDPIHYVGQAAPASLLFQIARNDRGFPLEKTRAFAEAASAPKQVQEYDADHYLNEDARNDRIAWVEQQLNL